MKLDPLTQKLSKHFFLHPSREKTLSAMILGVLCSGNVHHHSLARYVDSPNPKAGLRKVERFFFAEALSPNDYATAIVGLLGFKGKFDLCLDRTNWKFGNKDINYLVLSWRINKKISLPLLFVDLNKAGNSNTAERIDLLEVFNGIFGFHRIKSLMADREFVGKKWFKMLNKTKVSYFIRVKENTKLPWGKSSIQAKRLFHHLKGWQSRLVEKEMYGDTVYFAGTLSKSGELVIIMTNQRLKAKQILNKYRERWSIEELFRKLKTSGFHWENTHMKQSYRLISLLIILGFALLIAYLMGQDDHIPWKKTLNCPLYSIFKQGLINFQFILAKSLTAALYLIITLLERAQNVLF
jgi:hypothetical protein